MISQLDNDNVCYHQNNPEHYPNHLQSSDSEHDENMTSQSCCLEDSFKKASGSIVSEYSDVESIEDLIEDDIIPLDYRLDWSEELDVKLQYSIISCDALDDEDSVHSVSADWDMKSVFSIDEEMEEEVAPSLSDCIQSYTWNTNVTIIQNETL